MRGMQAVLEELGQFTESQTACTDAMTKLQSAEGARADAEVAAAQIGLAVLNAIRISFERM